MEVAMAKKVDTVPGVAVDEFVEEYVNLSKRDLVRAVFDDDGVQSSAAIGHDGKEYGDPVPMAPPVGMDQPDDLMTMIRRVVRSEEIRRAADRDGFDSFEEAEDFDVDDEVPDPRTPYEKVFDPKEPAPPAPQSAGVSPAPAPVSPSSPKTSDGKGGGGGGGSPDQPPAPPPEPPSAST